MIYFTATFSSPMRYSKTYREQTSKCDIFADNKSLDQPGMCFCLRVLNEKKPLWKLNSSQYIVLGMFCPTLTSTPRLGGLFWTIPGVLFVAFTGSCSRWIHPQVLIHINITARTSDIGHPPISRPFSSKVALSKDLLRSCPSAGYFVINAGIKRYKCKPIFMTL